MKENLRFNFYSVFKNEDANPYMDNCVMAVADGLGGSGSVVHRLDYDEYENLREEILQNAFYDFEWSKNWGIKEYIESLIEPMADRTPDTSALWASRIVIARFVYALTSSDSYYSYDLSAPNKRKELVEYIIKGMQATADYFRLANKKHDDNRLLLPTTLAAIKFSENGNDVRAEVFWAGDSRCYVLTQQGLKLLSVDDEDDSGAITNLFQVSDKETELHYKSYRLRKPCVLLTVSDGIFDPFEPHDNAGLEKTLLDAMEDAADTTEYKNKLIGVFNEIHADDATLNFTPFGFDSFRDMREFFRPRYKDLNAIINEYASKKDIIEISLLREEDIRGYMLSRTRDKFDKIFSLLYDCYSNGNSDVVLKDKFSDYIKQIKNKYLNQSLSRRQDEFVDFLSRLKSFLLENPETVIKDYRAIKRKRSGVLYLKEYSELKKYSAIIEQVKKNLENIQISVAKATEMRKDILEDISLRKRMLNILISNLEVCEGNLTKLEELYSEQYKLNRADLKVTLNLLDSKDLQCFKNVSKIGENICEYFENKVKLNKKLRRIMRVLDKKKADYSLALSNFMDYLKTHGKVEKYFTEMTLNTNGYALLNRYDDINIKEAVIDSLRNEKELLVGKIVENLIKFCDKTSVIDECYNAAKLQKFRTYYKTCKEKVNSVREFVERFDKFEKEYYIMLEE